MWSTPRSADTHAKQIDRFVAKASQAQHDLRERKDVAEQHFMIVLNRAPDDTEIETLFEAGCDDAAIAIEGGHAVAEFDREADSLAGAIVSAVRDIERAGFFAARVLDGDLMTLADIAERVGRSREALRLYSTGARGPGGFPPAVNPGGEVRFWRWTEVAPWLKAYGIPVAEEGAVLAAANAALQFRALSRRTGVRPLRALVA